MMIERFGLSVKCSKKRTTDICYIFLIRAGNSDRDDSVHDSFFKHFRLLLKLFKVADVEPMHLFNTEDEANKKILYKLYRVVESEMEKEAELNLKKNRQKIKIAKT